MTLSDYEYSLKIVHGALAVLGLILSAVVSIAAGLAGRGRGT